MIFFFSILSFPHHFLISSTKPRLQHITFVAWTGLDSYVRWEGIIKVVQLLNNPHGRTESHSNAAIHTLRGGKRLHASAAGFGGRKGSSRGRRGRCCQTVREECRPAADARGVEAQQQPLAPLCSSAGATGEAQAREDHNASVPHSRHGQTFTRKSPYKPPCATAHSHEHRARSGCCTRPTTGVHQHDPPPASGRCQRSFFSPRPDTRR